MNKTHLLYALAGHIVGLGIVVGLLAVTGGGLYFYVLGICVVVVFSLPVILYFASNSAKGSEETTTDQQRQIDELKRELEILKQK
jgi:flagellar basal body-associated protein FliL